MIVYSDSQAAIKSIRGHFQTSSLTKQCKDILNRTARRIPVTLTWIPGHSGYQGNETADKIAKIAASKPPYGPEPILPVSNSILKLKVKRWKKKNLENYWSNQTTQANTENFLNNINTKFTKQWLQLQRNKAKTITNLLMAQNHLNKHMHRIGKSHTPLCPSCGEQEETALHLIANCPAYTNHRRRILHTTNLQNMEITKDFPLAAILQYTQKTGRLQF